MTCRYFVLADCNNFYVSCERLFNPKLENKPVIILSNNDGCVVARSEEAKRLGIKMGQPFFQIKDFCERNGVFSLSSNYSLYGDLSQRVMEIIASVSEEIEIYSIDEAFICFPAFLSSQDVLSICLELRKQVKQWVGIPISLGIAPTKTLAKVANTIAKKKTTSGVYDLTERSKQESLLKQFPIEEIWGIGKNIAKRLRAQHIFSAWDLTQVPLLTIKQQLGVLGERLVLELQGTSCLDLETLQPKKGLSVSRSFNGALTTLQPIQEALAYHIATGCSKLRKQQLLAHGLYVYLESKVPGAQFRIECHSSYTYSTNPSDFTPYFLHQGTLLLRRLFQEGVAYRKCGILLSELIVKSAYLPDLFSQGPSDKELSLMKTIDAINHKYGKHTLSFGSMSSQGISWKPQCLKKSPYSTTDWKHLPVVKS